MADTPSVFLMLGPESGQKDELLTKFRASLEQAHGEPPEEHRVYPFKMEIADLLGLLRNQSLFSQHKLVIVYDAHSISKKSDAEALAGYITDPDESATLVLISDEYHLDRRIEKAATKKRIKVFWELFENQKRSWIQGYFRSAGFDISSDAVELILELVENDTADLRRECEKLVLYFDSGTAITESEIEEVVYHSKNENVFSLFSRIAGADFTAALETLHAMTLSGTVEPAQILGGLVWQVKRLLRFRRLKETHYSDDDIARQLNIRGKRNLRTYQTGSGNYSVPDLERMFVRITEYDALFRGIRTGIDTRILELMLYELIVSRGARPLVQGVSA